jgi:3-oxoacyl-[acyl-carrier-protein] synthase-1
MSTRVLSGIGVAAHTLVSALGDGREAHHLALTAKRSGLKPQRFESAEIDTWLGVVEGLDDLEWPADLAAFDCRNNRLAERGLRADGFAQEVARCVSRWGASRVGVFMGTSTSGILQTEQAYRYRDGPSGSLPAGLHYAQTHNTASLGAFVRERLKLQGPCSVASTACSSSAKVFGAAARMIRLGWIDAAVVGGVDSLCMTTLYGFNALELVSPDICRPWDAHRQGLSLGEGAGFALLERNATQPVGLLRACGESSDGHHMSSPHPQGLGAAAAIQAALAQAGMQPHDIDYLNLHGTATPGNDAAESLAVAAVFGPTLACSSTKGYTGHTLGAAGSIEASISLLALEHGHAPPNLNLKTQDAALTVPVLQEGLQRPLRHVASNSFGFGGSNCCLIFSRHDAGPLSGGHS